MDEFFVTLFSCKFFYDFFINFEDEIFVIFILENCFMIYRIEFKLNILFL